MIEVGSRVAVVASPDIDPNPMGSTLVGIVHKGKLIVTPMVMSSRSSVLTVKSGALSYHIKPARQSHDSPFRPIILLLPPDVLQPHEDTIEDRADRLAKKVHNASGWNGPPIAVCGTKDDELWRHINGAEDTIAVDLPKAIGILDGAHRHFVTHTNMVVNFRHPTIPVQLFPLGDPRIMIGTWPESGLERPYGPVEIRDIFGRQETVVPKATRFNIQGLSGEAARIMEFQPDLVRNFSSDADFM